jgi:hypothetical protein
MSDGQSSLQGANISFKNPFKGGLIDPAADPTGYAALELIRCKTDHA